MKTLVMNHNCFNNKKNNGKTLSSIFENYNKDRLADFYIFNETPDFDVCSDFFRITDYDILAANLHFTKAKGADSEELLQELSQQTDNNSPTEPSGIHKFIYRAIEERLPFIELAREIAWRRSKWLTPELVAWLDEFKPDVIFSMASNCPFFHRIIHWVQKRYNTKFVLFCTDDYTFVRSKYSPIAWLNYLRYMKYFKKSLRLSTKVFAISPAMQHEYAQKYGVMGIEMIGNAVEAREPTYNECQNNRFIYAGGGHYGRFEILMFVGNCIDKLNQRGFNATFDIYTPEKPPQDVIHNLNKIQCITYKGSLNKQELDQEIKNGSFVVFAESFDKMQRKKTRLSLSTKISEYLVSGRPILAVGPADVSSMEYLQAHGVAQCVTELSETVVCDAIENLISQDNTDMLARAMALAKQNHTKENLQQKLYEALSL